MRIWILCVACWVSFTSLCLGQQATENAAKVTKAYDISDIYPTLLKLDGIPLSADGDKLKLSGLQSYLQSEAKRHKSIGEFSPAAFESAHYLDDLQALVIRTSKQDHEKLDRLFSLVRQELKSDVVFDIEYSKAPLSVLNQLNLPISKLKFLSAHVDKEQVPAYTDPFFLELSSTKPESRTSFPAPQPTSRNHPEAGPVAVVLLDVSQREAFAKLAKNSTVKQELSPNVSRGSLHEPMPDPMFSTESQSDQGLADSNRPETQAKVFQLKSKFNAENKVVDLNAVVSFDYRAPVHSTIMAKRPDGTPYSQTVTRPGVRKALFDLDSSIPRWHAILIINFQPTSSVSDSKAETETDFILITPSDVSLEDESPQFFVPGKPSDGFAA